ncbi:MAG: NUDIX hydrolase [Bacteroidales bacterium]|nr:NUDIX hydrolase [Bacteroidales bacterium]
MENEFTYKYPHPAVATDSVVFGFDGKELQLLLIERSSEVYNGCWALPGGFMRMDESVEECAMRELREETGVRDIYLEQFHVFSNPDRDSRERVISVAFVALVRKSDYRLIASDDAARALWFSVDELPPLAFDHEDIVRMARLHLRRMLRESPIVFKLLDEKFSIAELQRLYELINGTTYDRRNFARKITSSGFLLDQGVSPVPSHNRFPNLYSFDEQGYRESMEAEADVVGDVPMAAAAPEPVFGIDRKAMWKQKKHDSKHWKDNRERQILGDVERYDKYEKRAAKEQAHTYKKKSRNPFDI